MNNAYMQTEEDVSDESSILSREKVETLSVIVEALQNIAGSSYWKVVEQNVFNVDLEKAKRRLVNEKDTVEIFRLQGEIRWGEKFNLEKLLHKYREELLAKRKNV